jgi:hypothetical protein
MLFDLEEEGCAAESSTAATMDFTRGRIVSAMSYSDAVVMLERTTSK